MLIEVIVFKLTDVFRINVNLLPGHDYFCNENNKAGTVVFPGNVEPTEHISCSDSSVIYILTLFFAREPRIGFSSELF